MNIEIELYASEWKQALGGLSKLVGKSNLPGLQCIRLARDENALVTMQGSDLESFVTYRPDQSPKGPTQAGAWLVRFEHLAKIVKASSPKDRLVVVIEGQQVFLRSFIGQTPVEEKVESLPLEDWPPALELKQPASRLENGFKVALQEALDCASRDPARFALSGAFLDVSQPEMHYLVGSDGRHLYAANSFRFDLQESIIIPHHKFLLWSGFLNDGSWSLSVLPGTEKERAVLKLASQHWEFVSTGIEADYPDWKQAVPPPERPKTVLVLSNASAACLSQAASRLPGDTCANEPITLRAGESQLLLRGRHRESEPWTDIAIPAVGIVGPAAEVTLNRIYLLKAIRLGLRELEISGPGAPVVFRNGNKQIVVASLEDDGKGNPIGEATSASASSTPQKPPCPSVRLDCQRHIEDAENPEEHHETTEQPASECRNGEHTSSSSASDGASSYGVIMEEIEQVKASLSDVLSQLDNALRLLKAAEAKQDLQDKELESIKTTLRSLREVNL